MLSNVTRNPSKVLDSAFGNLEKYKLCLCGLNWLRDSIAFASDIYQRSSRDRESGKVHWFEFDYIRERILRNAMISSGKIQTSSSEFVAISVKRVGS